MYERWERDREVADRMTAIELRSRRNLNSSDRRAVTSLLFGCIRYKRRLEWLLERLGLPASAQNMVHLQAGMLEAAPEALQEAWEALPSRDAPRDYIRFVLSYPDYLADAFLEILPPEEALEAAAAFNERAPSTLRANTLKCSRERLVQLFRGSVPTHYSPSGVFLPEGVNLNDFQIKESFYAVQEEASQIAALLSGAEPGQRILETGAGAGGKTLALAALMQNRGRILSLDSEEERLKILLKRASQAGVTNVTTACVNIITPDLSEQSAEVWRKIESWKEKADCVLLDAPCSGSGVMRRSPDSRWREQKSGFYVELQSGMLQSSAGFTAPGGRLVYITCSFERIENEGVVERFLQSEAGSEYTLEPAGDVLKETAARLMGGSEEETAMPDFSELCTGPYMRTWPHREGMDGFFAAVMRKKK